MAGLVIEIAGIAGFHEAVRRHHFGGLGGVLEVADEHARRLEQNLAIVGDADIDMRTGRTDRVGMDFAVRLGGDVEEGFGLAVKLLEVQPDRPIEGEQIGADRFAGGIGDAHARKTEHVLERRIDQNIAEPIKQPAGERHALAVENALAIFARDTDEVVEHLALESAGVLHADHHARQQHFERARRRKVKARTDLAQIGGRGVGAFRAGHAEAGHQTLRVIEIVIADPGQRQIGERDVFLGQLVEGDGVGRRLDRSLAGQHHAFRRAGCAGGVENDRRVRTLAGGDLAIEPFAELGIGGQRLAAVGDDIVHRAQLGVVIVAQAARFVVDHQF